MIEFIMDSSLGYENVECWKIDIPYQHHGERGYKLMIDNFSKAVLSDEKLIAPATEGINSLTISNAILLSSFQQKPVELPFDANAYASLLENLVQKIITTEKNKV